MTTARPVYRRNLDDAPRGVAVMARSYELGHTIPLHMHRRGQILHATSGIMRVETADAVWILPPARVYGCRRSGRIASACAASWKCARST